MTPVDDHAQGEDRPVEVPKLPDGESEAALIDVYETPDGIVFYDDDNPLAWLQSTEVTDLSDSR